MAYANIVVHQSPNEASMARLALASDLARRNAGYLIGAAACPVVGSTASPPQVAAALAAQQRRKVEDALKAVERRFHDGAGTILRDWRAGLEEPETFLARLGNIADLIVASAGFEGPFEIDAGALLAASGRPVLLAPRGRTRLAAEHVVVAWKNGPPAQRVLTAALPILAGARRVLVAGVGAEVEAAELEDVAEALRRHGVHAEAVWRPLVQASVGKALLRLCKETDSDLIVSGAYGRSRAREWILGGVTRELLRADEVCRLLAH